ncbi:ArsR/SmtB family transcription factor [Noviherbaspirillum soli]|uniref:ArsR/SmtB family transcription factor n=1 Tax=Noviherbaspirillum soli TaxID=1064518 RepID=UPI00188C959C|nr:metalloregulator ArsR/SmtB family transcription factor [Noviherbaspirillum soli]
MTTTANIDIEQLRQAAGQACGLVKVLANPDRPLLLCQMTQGEYCVGELEEAAGIRQPTQSQQLTVLRGEDMVATRREGKQICCRIASREALAVMTLLHALYCAPEKEKEKAS